MNHPCCNVRQFINALIIIATITLITITSCSGSHTEDKHKEDLPKALENKSSSYETMSKRGYDDLLESLYNELIENTPELKQFENGIVKLQESKSDSIGSFYKFNTKNQSYFGSANAHIEQIKDSVLQGKMKLLIANSFLKYNANISRHSAIIKYIETNEITLNDLHTVLKITRTLPLVEKFQKNNLPSNAPLDGFANELKKIVQLADTLSKK